MQLALRGGGDERRLHGGDPPRRQVALGEAVDAPRVRDREDVVLHQVDLRQRHRPVGREVGAQHVGVPRQIRQDLLAAVGERVQAGVGAAGPAHHPDALGAARLGDGEVRAAAGASGGQHGGHGQDEGPSGHHRSPRETERGSPEPRDAGGPARMFRPTAGCCDPVLGCGGLARTSPVADGPRHADPSRPTHRGSTRPTPRPRLRRPPPARERASEARDRAVYRNGGSECQGCGFGGPTARKPDDNTTWSAEPVPRARGARAEGLRCRPMRRGVRSLWPLPCPRDPPPPGIASASSGPPGGRASRPGATAREPDGAVRPDRRRTDSEPAGGRPGDPDRRDEGGPPRLPTTCSETSGRRTSGRTASRTPCRRGSRRPWA